MSTDSKPQGIRSPAAMRAFVPPAPRVHNTRYTVQKLIGEEWVTTARAEDLEAAARHAEAVGGSVRAVDRQGEVVRTWLEGEAP